MRSIGVLAAFPLLSGLSIIALGIALASGGPPDQTQTVRSAGGVEATTTYHEGFLGRDLTYVTLTGAACCDHVRVMYHDGPSDATDIVLTWIDNRHLRITYHTRKDDERKCEAREGDVTIECVAKRWEFE